MGNCSLRKNHIEPEVRSNTADTKVPVQHIHDNKQVKASSLRKQYSDGDFCFWYISHFISYIVLIIFFLIVSSFPSDEELMKYHASVDFFSSLWNTVHLYLIYNLRLRTIQIWISFLQVIWKAYFSLVFPAIIILSNFSFENKLYIGIGFQTILLVSLYIERRRFLILLKPYTMNRHETKSNKKHPEIQSDFVTSYGDELGPPTRIFTVA